MQAAKQVQVRQAKATGSGPAERLGQLGVQLE